MSATMKSLAIRTFDVFCLIEYD